MRPISAVLFALSLGAAAPAVAQSFISGSGPNDVWVADRMGRVSHFNGQGWVSMPATVNQQVQVRAIWAPSPREAWLVGDEGLILHLNGNAWEYVRAPFRRDLIAVGGCAANDVWIVGQSDDESRPPALFHYNGQAWTTQRAPVSFRTAGLGLTCPGGVAIAGTTFFDPRPDQRRRAGVLLTRNGDTWTARGYDGHAMNDQQLGSAGWTGIATCGTAMLLTGEGDGGPTILRSSGSGWSRVPMPQVPGQEGGGFGERRLAIACDGTPLVAWNGGFGRFANGQWSYQTGGGSASGAAMSMEQVAPIYASLMQRMATMSSQGRAIPRAMQDSIQMMSRMMQGASGQMMAAAQAQQAMAFGRDPAIWGPSGASFYLANEMGKVFRVRGDSSEAVWDASCVQMPSVPPCNQNGARGATMPAPAQGAAPQAPDEPQDAAPSAPAAPGKRLLPSVPRLPRRP